MPKARVLIPSMLVVALVGGFFVHRHYTRRPEYSLHQIQRALEIHDVAKFEKHVDLESVTSRLIDDALASSSQGTESLQDGPEALGSAIGAGLIQLMKPRLVSAFRDQVLRWVETGSVGDQRDSASADAPEISLNSMFRRAGAGEGGFRGIDYVKKQGKIALVGLGLRNATLESDLAVELKLRDVGGYWQLVELSNLPQLLARIEQLEAQRLAALNEPIRAEIARTMLLEHASKKNRTDDWGISKTVDIGLSIRNLSGRRISEYYATIKVVRPSGAIVKEMSVKDLDGLEPGGLGGGVWSRDVNMFDVSDNALYDLPSGQAGIEVEFTRIVFDQGTELKVFRSLAEAEQ